MILYTFPGDDREKLLLLLSKARQVLHKLHVPFTNSFLRKEMIKTYFSTFNNGDETKVADKDELSNLALVLAGCLKTYGINYELQEEAGVSAASFTIPGEGVIVFSKTALAGEPGFSQNRIRRVRDLFFSILILVLCAGLAEYALYKGLLLYNATLWAPPLLIQAAGILVCYQLFRLDKLNAHSKFCSAESDCKKVISFAASKIAGISMTDIGSVYFLGMLTSTLAGLYNEQYAQYAGMLYWLALIPLPYTVFSIYYQLAVQNKLCMLCCFVQALLWLQAVWYLFAMQPAIASGPVIIIALVAVIYTGLSTIFKLRLQHERLSLSDYILKTDPGFFRFQVDRVQQQHPPANIPDRTRIGNENAHHAVFAVLSTECRHCGKTLQELHRLGTTMQDDICITIANIKLNSEFDVPYTPYIFYNERPLPPMYYDLELLKGVLQNTTASEEAYEEQ